MAKATSDYAEENVKTEALYESVRGVLNKLTSRTFETSANQLRALEIDTQDRFQGVVDLVFEKAIDEASSSVAYALMCRELASMQVSGSEGKAEKEESNVNFRKLIITRCQMEFEKNTVDEVATAIKMKEIDATTDPEKKKELLSTLEEEERKMRIKSVGNIRFIGELFKQGMLTSNIMHRCIRHLVHQIDEKSLECLCKLLSTVGKDLKSEKQNLDTYFNRMMDIVNGKVPGKVSPRVRFMLQDVIELRMNNWVPRQDYSHTERMDQIRQKAETKRLATHMNNTLMDIQRKTDSNNERKWKPRRMSRNDIEQISGRSFSEDNWLHDTPRSQSMSPPQPIESVPPPAPVSVPIEAMPILTEEQLIKKTTNILNEFLADTDVNNAFIEIRETFDNSTFANFVREALNYAVEKSAPVRQQVSQLMTHLIVKQTLPLSLYLTGFGEVLETAEDLVIDIPKIWVYLAELMWYQLAEDTIPFSELKNIMAPLKNGGLAGKFLGELLTLLVQETGPNWTKERWEKSGLQWSDFLQENESVPDFIRKYKLEFMEAESNSRGQMGTKRTQELLFALLSNEKEYSVDDINSWISASVVQPQFIRVLVTAILKESIERRNDEWQYNEDKFENWQPLIAQYVATNELLEYHCLLAIHEYIHKLEQPKGLLLQVISKLWLDNIISKEALLAWEKNDEPSARAEKSVAMIALMSFFTRLKETDDESSETEA